ncbi:MAG: GNAT family N-acetyltransferase [Solirubrobacterales bacterium]
MSDDIRVGPIRPGEGRSASRVLGAAFVDDPVWSAIGPHCRRHRQISNRVSFAGILAGSSRHGAHIRVARSAAGDVVGASVAFAPGSWPIPEGSAVWELGWLVIAGPLPAWRGIRDDRAMRAQHVTHPHMYLWFLGVLPALQGRGVGRALLAELHADADAAAVPTFLETGSRENVSFYEGDGYEVIGEIAMPSGPTMWKMERPAEG